MSGPSVGGGRLPRKARATSWADRYLFIALFLLGTIGMVILKVLRTPQLTVTLVPALAMLLYAGYVVRAPRFRLRGDQGGDSLYYLGFLFTMVSLAYSLYEFSARGGATEQIVTNFGIALTTTILGLMFRVVFHQLREDPFDVEREVRADLADAAQDLKGVILQSVADFDTLRVVISQAVDETTSHARKTCAEAITTAVADLNTLRATITRAVEETTIHATQTSVEAITTALARQEAAAQALTATVVSANEAVNSHTAAMKGAGARVIASVERLAQRLDNITIPTEKIRVAVEELAHTIEAATQLVASGVGDARVAVEHLNKALVQGSEMATELSRQLALLHGATTAHHESVARGAAELERISTTLNGLNTGLVEQMKTTAESYRKDLERMAGEAKANGERVEAARRQLDVELQSSTESVGRVHRSLASMTSLIVDKLDAKHRRL